MQCPHILTSRKDEDGHILHRCALIAEASGRAGVYISDERCTSCSRTEDAGGDVRRCVTHLLRNRIIRDALRPASECSPCGGSMLTVEEALIRLKAREGARAATALVEAVRNGMPAATAEALARKHFPEAL